MVRQDHLELPEESSLHSRLLSLALWVHLRVDDQGPPRQGHAGNEGPMEVLDADRSPVDQDHGAWVLADEEVRLGTKEFWELPPQVPV